MQIQPRDYQREAVNSVFNYFQTHETGNPVIAMPTGTGKSIVIADFLDQVFTYYQNQKILILTHVKELISQNYNKLTQVWPGAPAGIYSAGLKKRDVRNPIIFGGIASVANRAAEFGHVDLIIIDEAHLVSPNDSTMYQKFIQALLAINPYLRIIGLTATPWRIGQGRITDEGGLFTDICFDITGLHAFNRLLAEGYLCPLTPKKTDTILEVDGVHMRGGEFIQKELQQTVDREALTRRALEEMLDVCTDRKAWLIFSAGIEHAVHITEMLLDFGVPAGVVHGGNKKYKMSPKQRDNTIEAFKAGHLRVLVNNNVLTTGFDHPAIDMIGMLRPTMSPGLWVQMLGRGTRPVFAPGHDLNTIEGRLTAIYEGGKHDCLVMDFGGNTKRLGPINDPVIPKKKGQKGGEAPIKLCDKSIGGCGTYIHASLKFCPHCNKEFEFKNKLHMTASTDEIIKGDVPIVELFKVDHITYSLHTKMDRPPSIKVSYYCGYNMFNEYVCIEHQGGARGKARRWWRERAGDDIPKTTAEALERTSALKTPTSLRVWINKKYPEIMSYCFDGTHFGTEEIDEFNKPSVQNNYISNKKK